MHRLFVSAVLVVCSLSILGCRVESPNRANDGVVEAAIVAGRFTTEDASTQDLLYAYLKGSGIGGGWITDINDTQLQGSALTWTNIANRYERIMLRPIGGFLLPTYRLRYSVGGETKHIDATPSWTLAPHFLTSPGFSWDADWRRLTISNIQLTTGFGNAFIRIYDESEQFLLKESMPVSGPQIIEVIPSSFRGKYKVMVVVDTKEGGRLQHRTIHLFRARTF